MHNRLLIPAIATIVISLGMAEAASAHDLQVKVKLPPGAVVVEAGFDDDTPAQDSRVTITDAVGNLVASGRTDEKGVCKLTKLGAGKYLAAVEALGHRDVVEFEVAAGQFEYSNWRLNKTVGLTAGVAGLFATSFVFWWVSRRRSIRQAPPT